METVETKNMKGILLCYFHENHLTLIFYFFFNTLPVPEIEHILWIAKLDFSQGVCRPLEIQCLRL